MPLQKTDSQNPDINYKLPTPTSFIDELRNHEQVAWERFSMLYGRLVLHWLIDVGVSNREVRKEMLYDICILVMESISHFHKEKPTDSFRAWLHKVVENYVNRIQREYKQRGELNIVYEPDARAISDPHSSILETVIKREQEQLRQTDPDSLDNLTDDDIYAQGLMKVLGLQFSKRDVDIYYQLTCEKKNAAQIAELTGLSSANIRKIRQRINDYLKDYYGELNDFKDDNVDENTDNNKCTDIYMSDNSEKSEKTEK